LRSIKKKAVPLKYSQLLSTFVAKLPIDSEHYPILKRYIPKVFECQDSKILKGRFKKFLIEIVPIMMKAADEFSPPELDLSQVKEDLQRVKQKPSDFALYDERVEQSKEKFSGLVAEEKTIQALSGATLDLSQLEMDDDSGSDKLAGFIPADILTEESEEERDLLAERGRINKPIDPSGFPELLLGEEIRVAGVDLAAYGSDSTVITVRYGPHLVDVMYFQGEGPMQIVSRIVTIIEEHQLDQAILDLTGGLGQGVMSRLEQVEIDRDCEIIGIVMNEKPKDESLRCLNRRAELYLNLKERFLNGTITLPMDKRLIKQLSYITYKTPDGGPLRITSKDVIKGLLGESPDAADSLSLCYSCEPPLELV
jgi:hypothetical protein